MWNPLKQPIFTKKFARNQKKWVSKSCGDSKCKKKWDFSSTRGYIRSDYYSSFKITKNRRTDLRTDRPTDGQTDGRTDRTTYGRTDRPTYGQTDQPTDRWTRTPKEMRRVWKRNMGWLKKSFIWHFQYHQDYLPYRFFYSKNYRKSTISEQILKAFG